ncbi:cytochrome P450 93B16-like [Prosopis cineraria]|uniref:cytochrome P450 93B16-like n=1 Tax=Prosopis cineraria TaxID=364024 RepID=UPI00240EF5AE|nr:cytochrome P450 93B16-like [Prosopis cineraria]
MVSQLVLLGGILLASAWLLLFMRRIKSKPTPTLSLPPSPPALPLVGHLHLLKPLVHQALHELQIKYGPLMHLRLGSTNMVVASTPELAKELLKTNELAYCARPMSIAINLVTYDNAAFAFAPYNTYWRFIKKLSNTELLGARTIRQFCPGRASEIHRFIKDLMDKSMTGESVNLTQELMKLSGNVISRMMLSIQSTGTDRQAEEARNLAREVTQIFGEFNVADFIKICKTLDVQGFRKRAVDLHKRFDAFLERIISAREESRKQQKASVKAEDGPDQDGEEKVRDFLDILLDVAEDESSEVSLTRNHVKALILDFFTAGTDTTATAVEWTVSELIKNPRVLKKAQEEVDRVTEQKRLINESDIPNLPYINAIVKEIMRLHPPVAMINRQGTQDCVVSGYLIPKGTFLFVNVWAMGRDPKIWQSPLEFAPERFLEGKQSGLDVKGHHYELLPFGSGRRGCPGQPLAMRELPVVIGALIQCFTWKPLDSDGKIIADGKTINMDERPGLTAPRANDLLCIPVARFNPFDGFLQV